MVSAASRASPLGTTLSEADAQALLRVDFETGHDDLKRSALADKARQAHRAPILQRHAPAAVIHAHIGTLGHHAAIGP
jgi:hypothetical protein